LSAATHAAMMPVLAKLVDTRHTAAYGSVFALYDLTLAVALILGPIIGGLLSSLIQFPW
jgi:DHA1 family solute carrier family 18 vesicular amine transporter 1/2